MKKKNKLQLKIENLKLVKDLIDTMFEDDAIPYEYGTRLLDRRSELVEAIKYLEDIEDAIMGEN